MIELLDRFPAEGETVVTEDGVTLTAKKVDNNRIETVTILLPESGALAKEQEEDRESSETDL